MRRSILLVEIGRNWVTEVSGFLVRKNTPDFQAIRRQYQAAASAQAPERDEKKVVNWAKKPDEQVAATYSLLQRPMYTYRDMTTAMREIHDEAAKAKIDRRGAAHRMSPAKLRRSVSQRLPSQAQRVVREHAAKGKQKTPFKRSDADTDSDGFLALRSKEADGEVPQLYPLCATNSRDFGQM
eukprot:COSAG01_NODE_1037_length_11984_cov_106.566176_12_plen_182_part_00